MKIHPAFNADQIEIERTAQQTVLLPPNWNSKSRIVEIKTLEDDFVFGKNGAGDKAKGQIFSIGSSALIKGVYVSLLHAGPSDGYIELKLWDYSGVPKAEITSKQFLISELLGELKNGSVFLSLEEKVIVKGEVLIGIDFVGDSHRSIGIVSSADGDAKNSNIVWEQWSDDSWHLVNSAESWNLDVELAIFPIIEYQKRSVDFAGGTGTRNDPWQVGNAEQLDAIRNFTAQHFIQIADIDLDQPPYNLDQGWQPIGLDAEEAFTGSYNGNGFHINGLYIERPDSDYIGLFARGIAAEFKSINLINTEIIGKDIVGGLIGLSQGAHMEYINIQGSISGNNYLGGVVGIIRNGVIFNSTANINLSGHRNVGGIAGLGQADKCSAWGSINGFDLGIEKSSRIGGLLGEGFALNCSANISITGGQELGGLIGIGSAVASYSSGTVTGTGDYIGGLIGKLTEDFGNEVDYPEYASGETAPLDGPIITEQITSPGGGPIIIILEDGTRVLIPEHDTPLNVTVEKLPLEMNLDQVLPGWSGLRTTGSMRRIVIEGEGDPENIKPIISFPAYEAGTINVETINAIRVGTLVIDGEQLENQSTLLPIIQLDEGSLKFIDTHFPESIIYTDSLAGDSENRNERRFSGNVNYFLITFDKSINWSKRPELVRMIPDTLFKEKGFRRPLSSLEKEQKVEISKQPICNVVILVHGHNEEEKNGFIGNLIEGPWEFYYKRVVWEQFHEELLKYEALDLSKECTVVYEFISPTYRPIFSPVGPKSGYYHNTLGEDMGRLINQEFEFNSQLKAMLDEDVPFNLFFVAHSQGGLIMRSGLRFIDTKILKHTKKAITWGSPHNGAGLYSLRYALAVGHNIVIGGYKLPMQNLGKSDYFQTALANKAIDAPGILDMRWESSKEDLLRLGQLLEENTETINEFKDTELPNGKAFFSDNLKLFNENEGKFQLNQLANKYVFYTGHTPKIAELEIEFVFTMFKNLWKFKKPASEIEIGAQANKLTMQPAFSDSDGAVPTYSQRGTGIWPEGNIQRRFFEDVDHQEFYGGEKLMRTEDSKAKGRSILHSTYADMELDSESRRCPWIETTRLPDGDSTIIEGQFFFPIFDNANGGDGKPGLWISDIKIRKDSLNGEEILTIRYEIEEDGSFIVKGKTTEMPEEGVQFIVLILKDNSEVFMQADDIKIVYNKDLMKWYNSIQAAVDEASEGHEIIVHPGTLRDPAIIDKTVTIRSVMGREVTIIDGVNNPNKTAFILNNCSPTIDGFTIKNWRKGIAMGGLNTYPEISNNIIENNEWGAVQLLGGSAVKLLNNKIFNNNWKAVEVYTSVQGETCIIEGNEIYNNFNGIIVENKVNIEIKNNHIYNNVNGGSAIRLSDEVTAIITDNLIENNGRDGINASDQCIVDIRRNIIKGHYQGISVSSAISIVDNIVTDNQFGISGRNTTIARNTVSNSTIFAITPGDMTIIENNTITNNTCYGISSGNGGTGSSNLTIRNNTITGNYGGIFVQNVTNVEIVQNTIEANTNSVGVFAKGQSIQISNNQINNNSSGGIRYTGGSVTISDNTISNNQAEYGGGVYLSGGEAILTNNIISNNFATRKGGGVYGLASGWARYETVTVNNMPKDVKRHSPCFPENSNTYSGNAHGETFGEWGPGTDNWCPDAGYDVTID